MASILEDIYGPPLNWTSTEKNKPRPPALHVILHKREYVFPWSRFIYAEGSNDAVTISFPTHQVVITGYGLDHFLSDLAAQCVASVEEPHRADRFRAATEPEPKGAINEITVRPINDEQ